MDLLLKLSYIALFLSWGLTYFIIIPVPVVLILISTSIVIIGSYNSLKLVSNDVKPEDKETLTQQDVYSFPILGSASLLGLYLVFKYFDKETVNMLISYYFLLISVLSLTGWFSKLISSFIISKKQYGFKTTLPYIGEINCLWTVPELFCLAISIYLSYIYFQTKHFMLNNLIGISFCIQSIQKISLSSYKAAATLLILLFFYDIFWVFGTDVMVSVAKNLDGPIKLLFPIEFANAENLKGKFSLLGLGDIVIPGLFIALLIRFDAVIAKIPLTNLESAVFNKPYFIANIIGYALGLLTTVLIMQFFKAAQPALLYLVPAALISSIFVAYFRSELNNLLEYDEEKVNKDETVKKSE